MKQSQLPSRRYARMTKTLLKNLMVTQPKEKKGFGSSGLYTRGKLFAFLSHKNRLILKLPRERVNELIARHDATRWNPRGDGRGFKEWVVLRPSSEIGWLSLAREAMKFVTSQNEEN